MPISCRAVSLLTLFVGSQRCERSRTLLFCDSFDHVVSWIIRSFVDCFRETWTLTLEVGLSGVAWFSIGHATVSSEAFFRGGTGPGSAKKARILFRFRNSPSRFRVS